MTNSSEGTNQPPHIGSDAVFFLGNGILRVPSWIEQRADENILHVRTPSWTDYMGKLWRLVRQAHRNGDLLGEFEFAHLAPPRQAEWFDRNFRSTIQLSPWEISALRLHHLGIALHPVEGLLTNELLLRIARLVTNAAAQAEPGQTVDVITTNLDCSIEQNIAWSIESWIEQEAVDASATIEVIAGFRSSVVWNRAGANAVKMQIRLWKIHGCLRDLKQSIQPEQWARLRKAMPSSQQTEATPPEFCGMLPKRDRLTPKLAGRWLANECAGPAGGSIGIFSIGEYFRNLSHVVKLGQDTHDEFPAAEKSEFDRFIQILQTRPLVMLGYSLQDEDVDIVYLLQTYISPRERVMLVSERGWNDSKEARIAQMGIRSWRFSVGPRGYCREPGRLERASRHEWRDTGPVTSPPTWESAIQRVVENAWLQPQRICLDQLLRQEGLSSAPQFARGRLVFAGLASIWHAFSQPRGSDFPVERRVSARYTAVDSQVPGGSGLVPCMEAAAMAGPAEAGQLAFLTNVPQSWNSWSEIEEFCLSAGVDVQPHWASDQDPALRVGRTSYVLLWDLKRDGDRAPRPKQRFIIDVPSHADEEYANRTAKLESPKARIEPGFQGTDGEDLLFADKETEMESLCRWRGPLIFETGASGIELLSGRPGGALRPTLWTSGIGSFVRTILEHSHCLPTDRGKFPKTLDEVLYLLDSAEETKFLLRCPQEIRRSYIAKLMSFDRVPWDEGRQSGFQYTDELDYGNWLLKEWWTAGPLALELLSRWDLLGPPHGMLGRGLLTTIHEGGLMGAWELEDGRKLLVRVGIQTEEFSGSATQLQHIILCEARTMRGNEEIEEDSYIAAIEISDRMTLSVDGESQSLELATAARWNTLAAGDTVRGALAYGLWAFLYDREPHPGGLAHIAWSSATLATMKCYAGSFVNYLRLLDGLRSTRVWKRLWGARETDSWAGIEDSAELRSKE